MLQISLSSLATCTAICLLYVFVVLAILQFSKAARVKPDPSKSSTMRVELKISKPSTEGANSLNDSRTCTTTTFAFADELAKTIKDFLAGYSSPSRSDLLNNLQQTGGTIASLFITQQHDNHVRNLTLLGEDAEKVSSYLMHCFNCQLACGTDEFHFERVSLTA